VMSGELSARTLHEVLAQKLEELILQGLYAPGEMLPSARELAQRYGVSQTVVRDATRSLAGKGLVRVQQGVGTSVTKDADAGLVESFRWALLRRQVTRREVVELGSILETQIAVLAALRRTEEDLRELEGILHDYERLAPAAPWEQISACQVQFHTAVMRAAHNRAILAVLEPLIELVLGSAEPQQPGEAAVTTYQQHQRIFECIQNSDPEATRAAMEQHFASP
jgi:GntR family transcriptional regulator, transcriptional repressor for pyruvate dehydrogenase complex